MKSLLRKKRRAFSLTEFLITMSIMTAVGVATMTLFMDGYKASFSASMKNNINQDIRKVTREMSIVARQANYFALYKSMSAADHDSPGDRLFDGETGNLLVLAYQGDPPNLQFINARPILRLVGYYLNDKVSVADAPDEHPIFKFDVTIPTEKQYNSLESLIPEPVAQPVSKTGETHTKVVELSEGLANGDLFYNFQGKSIMVNAKISHGNAAKRITDTYNFTISPRGFN